MSNLTDMQKALEIEKSNAINDYEGAVADLKKYCEDETNFHCEIDVNCYPIMVRLIPAPRQQSMFETQVSYAVEPGVDAVILLSLGRTTTVSTTMKFRLDSSLLKKIIKKAEKVGKYYLHAFRCIAQYTIDTGDLTSLTEFQDAGD